MTFIDTNILVRYLTGLPPDQAATAADIIDSGTELWITVISLAEVYFIMSKVAGVPRVNVVGAMIDFMQKDNRLSLCRQQRLFAAGTGNDAALRPGFHWGRIDLGDSSHCR